MNTTDTHPATDPTPDTYNGWSNRETWAAALHLSNDYDLYRICVALVADADADHGPGSIAAADALKAFVDDATEAVFHDHENGAEWARMMAADVGSFYRVDWSEVAASFRDE